MASSKDRRALEGKDGAERTIGRESTHTSTQSWRGKSSDLFSQRDWPLCGKWWKLTREAI